MPGYKRPCRFCGNLVDENSTVCPFCSRHHPLQMVCPYCFAPIVPEWKSCNVCARPLVVACSRCGSPVGPDADACEKCRTVVRFRCPTCLAVVEPGTSRCARCGQKLKEYWRTQGH